MIIKNLPQGTQYTVEEAEANQNCTTTFENVSGSADGTSASGARMLVTNDFTSAPPEEFIEFDPDGGTGSVALTKTVAGDQGQTDRTFTFQVRLTNADGTAINGWLNYSRDGKVVAGQLENGALDIPVAHGQTVVIGAIPVGAHYTVTEVEANQDGYTTTVRGAQSAADRGVVTENTRSNAQFVNTKGNVDGTGSTNNSAKTGDTTPWIPIASIAVAAVMVLVATRVMRNRAMQRGGMHARR